MSGSEDMIEILVAERDRALREVSRLKRGIEAYRRQMDRLDGKAGYIPAVGRCRCGVCAWEREDAKRRESGDER